MRIESDVRDLAFSARYLGGGRPDSDLVVVATDAALDTTRVAGGYIASSGHYGCWAHPYPHQTGSIDRTTTAELRAVLWGLEAVLPDTPTQTIQVLTDSQSAVTLLKAWANGDLLWKPGDHKPTWSRLQDIVKDTPRLRFEHQKGHAGHPMNETADSLAKLAFRYSRGQMPKADVPVIATQWCEKRLDGLIG